MGADLNNSLTNKTPYVNANRNWGGGVNNNRNPVQVNTINQNSKPKRKLLGEESVVDTELSKKKKI